MLRIKTREEFEDEFGRDWRLSEVTGMYFNHSMDYMLGKSIEELLDMGCVPLSTSRELTLNDLEETIISGRKIRLSDPSGSSFDGWYLIPNFFKYDGFRCVLEPNLEQSLLLSDEGIAAEIDKILMCVNGTITYLTKGGKEIKDSNDRYLVGGIELKKYL